MIILRANVCRFLLLFPANVRAVFCARTIVRIVLFLILVTSTARADVVYGELLGKAGAYGIGYEHAITDRRSLGAAGSFAVVRGEQIATAAPYVHGHLWHALFCDIGAIIAHTRVASPVADWHGMSDTGGGGFASLGL